MIHINFYPEADIPRFIEAAEEYTNIWKEDSVKITDAIERISGFKFRAEIYNAIILDNKPSGSYPLTLLSSYTHEQKKSTLIHELTHKVLPRNPQMKESEIENHKILNLTLHDIWTDLYGKEFADSSVKRELEWVTHIFKLGIMLLDFQKKRGLKNIGNM
jgi:hypothetical protein